MGGIARRLPIVVLMCALGAAAGAGAEGPADLVLILDASGSMWGQIGGENKIVIARRVLGGLIDQLPDDGEVGMVAYGHRREGDCEDIETVVPLGPLDRAALKSRVEGLNPRGKTPITAAVSEAFGVVKGREGPATVILVSDGLETCGGDPCRTVREAKAAGIEFVMHVVGFDVAGEDVSELECAAQAGGGLFFSAESADELSAALDRAVAVPADLPAGRLSVKAVADGSLQDVAIRVIDAASGEEVIGARTYADPGTNPRLLPLADGEYDVEVRAVGLRGDVSRSFEGVVIADGSTVKKEVDFSTGELKVKVTRNGELSDATVRVRAAASGEEVAAGRLKVYPAAGGSAVASGRTYTSERSNPKSFILEPGEYRVEIQEIRGERTETAVAVTAGESVERIIELEG